MECSEQINITQIDINFHTIPDIRLIELFTNKLANIVYIHCWIYTQRRLHAVGDLQNLFSQTFHLMDWYLCVVLFAYQWTSTIAYLERNVEPHWLVGEEVRIGILHLK